MDFFAVLFYSVFCCFSGWSRGESVQHHSRITSGHSRTNPPPRFARTRSSWPSFERKTVERNRPRLMNHFSPKRGLSPTLGKKGIVPKETKRVLERIVRPPFSFARTYFSFTRRKGSKRNRNNISVAKRIVQSAWRERFALSALHRAQYIN